ncbi:MAG: UDP-N-acetylmuramoyl-L-alanine--D-glutamate ligase [Campylobacter sp.]|nr:UDP-N-acetylmuramoyl-L-alanine--D-glutamate ligase [Campylobacter sp.]
MMKSLFGYGKTTKAIAKSGGWTIFDNHFLSTSKDEFGNYLLPVSEFDPLKSELEIPSPGFPKDHEIVKKAKNLISEYDYFFDKMPKSVWISGTNGKTTTTQMTQFLLEKFGSAMGGNVGIPLADMDKNAKIWVLETSSFTLHYTNTAYPEIYSILPITSDHLSWHGGMSEYIKTKLKPLSKMKQGSVAIIPEIYANTPTLATVLAYKNEQDLAKIAGVEISCVKFKVPFLMDALMSLCIEKVLFDRAEYELLNKFVIENNKLEELRDHQGRLWVNDTKATNIDACIQALNRYKDREIHLIIGGDDKGVDLTPVFERLASLNTQIYAIGSNTDRLMKMAKEFGVVATRCEFLSVAVSEIAKNLDQNGVGLLSPACASLDQFSSYAVRGDEFKRCISALN